MDEYESFVNKVSGYEDALRQEHEVASSAGDVEVIRKLIDDKIAKALPGFVDDLIMIARTGDNDNVKLKAIQWAFDWYFKQNPDAADPFTKLLNELTNTPSGTQDTTN